MAIGAIVIIGILLAASSLRYKITGTNEGYIYKTDRLTGKTSIVGPRGEVEIEKYEKPTPTPQPQQFPLQDLEVLSVKSRSSGYYEYADITIKNNNVRTASNIKYKITYSKTNNGDVYDTQYQNGFKTISGGDTITDSLSLEKSDNQYWYNVFIISAEY